MRVDGVEPAVLNRAAEQLEPKQVEQARGASPEMRVRQRGQALGRSHNLEQDRGYPEQLQEEVERLNTAAEIFNISLRFTIHEETERIIVRVFDRDNDQLIKEIPPEKVLNLVAQIQNMIGILIDERR